MIPIEEVTLLIALPLLLGVNPYACLLTLGLLLRFVDPSFASFDQPEFQILREPIFLLGLSMVFMIEAIADRLPFVDHVSDLLHLFIKPFIASVSTATILEPYQTQQLIEHWTVIVGAVGGGGLALTSHLTKAGVRLKSSYMTGGIANHLLSWLEDLFVVAGSLLIWSYPAVALICATIVLVSCILLLTLTYRTLMSLRRFKGASGVSI